MEIGSLTTNIAKEIVKECKIVGTKVEENFAYNFVKLLQLDPQWEISETEKANRAVIQKVVKYSVETLKHEFDPGLIVMKMQVFFASSFLPSEKIIENNRSGLRARLKPLEHEILKARNILNYEHEYTKFYRNVVYYITLLSGLGNPAIQSVFKEAQAALQSIFSKEEAEEFLHLSRDSCRDQLNELTKLVTGIRLFNRDCRKGGEGIEDLPKLINWAVEAISADLEKLLVFVMERVNILTSAVDKCYVLRENEYGYYVAMEIPADTIEEADLEYYKDLLLLYRQYELYIRNITDEVNEIQENIPGIFEEFEDILCNIHDAVRFRTAVPVEEVFPLFWQLADNWESMQDIAILLAKQNQIVMTLQSFATQLTVDDQLLKSLLGPDGSLSDTQRFEMGPTRSLRTIAHIHHIEVLESSDVEDFDALQLEYRGFCAYKLVETNGGLIPGNPNIGVIKYKKRYYSFSSLEAAKAWCGSSNSFIRQTLQLARKKIELVHFLQLYDQLLEVQKIGKLFVKRPLPVITFDVETQTDLHPVESNIVPGYMHNIWDLKRQALYLANLLNCQSHSTQTSNSDKRTIRAQTYENKEKVTQTKKDNYTNVPKSSNYIYGLRGRLDNKQFVITLTRPVNE